jgi:hypothetical protein
MPAVPPSNPAAVTLVLGVVYRTISGFLLRRAGLTRASGHTGAVTVVQRFGSALNLNVHFHLLFLDGVYVNDDVNSPEFRHVSAPGATIAACGGGWQVIAKSGPRYHFQEPWPRAGVSVTASASSRETLGPAAARSMSRVIRRPGTWDD